MYIIYTYTLQKVCRVVASCIWMEGRVHFLIPKWYPLTDMPFFRPKPSAVQSYDRKRWFQEMRAWLLVFQGLPGPVLNLFQLGLALGTFNDQVLPLLLDFWLFLGRKCQIINYEQLKHMSHVFWSWLLGKKFPSLNWNVYIAGMSRMTLPYFRGFPIKRRRFSCFGAWLLCYGFDHVVVAPSLATRMPNIWSCKPSGVTMKFSNVTCTSKNHPACFNITWQTAVKCRKN